jgi:clan AA aspartic protease (TIGR02281 family)
VRAYAPPTPPVPPYTDRANIAVNPGPTRVRLQDQGTGTFRVAGIVNSTYRVAFVLDTGASAVSISAALFRLLYNNGTLTDDDLIDVVRFKTANGVIEGLTFRLRSIQVGTKIVYNVVGSVSRETPNSGMLLGQSFLRKFRSWTVDNTTHKLVID